ncbi:biopolymer transporter ExbD [uncultured Psychroserpens sp.]|uniref:ExbD/TolR family protein n=1 Tax=uncultured Psychroserpens sp. TaxID=255436 RepID=UPI00260DB03B|nr:biopolymer transporter ExbD [uncultured Psychroserpens sp.]
MKRNLKPFIYIGLGVVLLVTLFYFKSLTDKIQYDNSVDLELPITTPNDTIQNDNVVNVFIKEDLSIYVDSIKRDIKDLEGILINRAVNDSLTIVLGAEKSVPVSNIIDVMTVANKHKFKTILAVKPEM